MVSGQTVSPGAYHVGVVTTSHLVQTLLQARPSSGDDITALFITALLIGLGVSVVYLLKFKQRLKTAEARVGQLLAEVHALRGHMGSESRESVMFEQQKQVNALVLTKLQAEIKYVETQLEMMKSREREEAGKEAHELMVEKMKLEIDGLRLHNAEARRRIDDWRAD